MIDYDGRRFRSVHDEAGPVAMYRQRDDLVWAEFGGGGEIRRGSLTGICAPDGVIDFAYTMVLTNGKIISGHSTNTPEYLPDGRIQLNEVWERFGEHAGKGVSAIAEIAD
jgi:hypothetical protein